MTVFRTEQAQKVYDASQQGGYNVEKLKTTEYNGRVRLFHGHFEAQGAVAAGDTLEVIPVPSGKILPISTIVSTEAVASGVKLGYAEYVDDDGNKVVADDDAFITGGTLGANTALALNTLELKGKAMITATGLALAKGDKVDVYIYCVVD